MRPTTIPEAIKAALALHKAPATRENAATAAAVIPLLVAALGDSDEDLELEALANEWARNPASFGRRVRDLAVELARRVASLRESYGGAYSDAYGPGYVESERDSWQ